MLFPHLQPFKHVFHQKNFFAAASCWLLQQEKKAQKPSERRFRWNMDHLNQIKDVLLVHDVAEKQDRLDDDEDYEMNGG